MKKNYLLTPFKVPIALVLLCFITFSTWAQSITTHPTTLTKNDGQAASFHVVVNGTVSAYQWQVSRDGGLTYKSLADDNTYSGSKTTTLNISKATVAMNGNFYQLTTVVNGQSLTSRQAILNVFPTNSSAQWELQGSAGFSEQPTASYANIVFAPNGTPYVAYMDGFMGKISVMKWNGSSWEKVGLSGFSAGMANHVKIAISPLGVPYVAFMDDVNLGKATVMKFNGSQWVNVGSAGFSAGKAYHLSLAFYQTEHPYLAFSDGSVGNKASVMKFDGTTWQIFGTSGFSNGGCTSLNLAFNGLGVPYVGYVDSKDFLNPNITVMTFVNNSWTVVGSPAFYPERINDANLALDPTGIPYVAFRVGKYGNKANVMKFDGISWQSVGTPHFSENASTMLTFIIDPLGDPYVTFIDSGKNNTNQASVMKWNGNEWVLVGEASFSQAAVNYPRIALDLHSNPFVAYTDQAYGGKMTVMKFLAAAPTISQQPVDQNILPTQTAEFSVITTAISPTYQWQISTDEGKTFNPITDGSVYTGATTSILNLIYANASMNGYLYRVVINNGKDSYSDSAALKVQSGILIQQQPQDIMACPASNALLSVQATGVTHYQWQLDEGLGYYDLSDNSNYVGTGSATLTINDVTAAMNGHKYRVLLSASSTPTITQTALLSVPTLVVDSKITAVSCSGSNTAKIVLTTTGGTAPYSYLWDNLQTSNILEHINAGSYSVTITDTNGCQIQKTYDINQPTALAVVQTQVNVSCNGQNNGSATITASGGTAPYTYLWSNGATTPTINDLVAKDYTVSITDSKGCEKNVTIKITEPITLDAGTSANNVTCFGSATGFASVAPKGGSEPYTYLWSNGATTAKVTGLSIGEYSVTIKDNNGCEVTKTLNIAQFPQLQSTAIKSDVGCYGSSNGSATITVTGGAPPYKYSWAPYGGSQATASGLIADTYTVTITDANSCTLTHKISISEPKKLAITATQTHVSCYGGSNGSASVNVTEGTTPYTYLWSTGETASSIQGLKAGNYKVWVNDANNCTTSKEFTITQPQSLAIVASQTLISCNGSSTGSASITATGGTAPYSYLWSNGATTSSITDLAPNSYSVEVTDLAGCTVKSNTIIITQPTALKINPTLSAVSCNGYNDGSATATVTGGSAPYTYSWTRLAGSAQTATGLTAGIYTVTVTDSKGCVISHSYEITEPIALNANTSQQNVACFGSATASASATPTGGTAPYSYKWSTGATTQAVTGLSMGDYQLVITDAKGCSITKEFTILQYPKMEVVTSQTDAGCYGSFTGSASVAVSGGASGYTYSWAPTGGSDPTATGLQAGQYTVTITDAKGCTTTESFTISQPEPLVVTSTQTNISCSGNPYGTATIETTGGSAPYTYIWTTPNAVLNQAIDLALGTYTVQVTDAKGCTATKDITIISETLVTVWNGTSWSNGSPNSLDTRAIFQADFNTDTNLKACSISVENNAKVVIKPTYTLTVNHEVAIEVGADLIIEDQANLLQIHDNTNSGMATVISRSSPMKWLDYTIWSSPVSSQNVFDFSPETVSTRIFTYKGNLQTVNQSPINSTLLSKQSVMEIGYGYFFRAPNTYHSLLPNSAIYEGKFRGVLNNGSLVVNTYSSQFTSVGNPYPSALDLSDIVTNYGATIYFYTNSYEYINGAYTGNNYASYNSTGATSSGNGIVPTGVVQKGQGFIIETPTSAIEFNNSMRVNAGGAMMKPNIIERHRYWIDLIDTKTKLLYNQILVGYLQGATSGFDDGKDAKLFGHEGTTLFSLIDQDQTAYIIQGKGLPFIPTDKVTLGFKVVETGNFTIKINQRDGLFEKDQQIILVDKLLNIEHDLILGDYLFTSESGFYNQRFEIVYNSQKLATEKPKDVATNDWLAYRKGDLLQIESIGFDIQHVEIYDMLGKRLFKSAKINAKNYVLPVINNQQILIIKLQTMGNQTLYKKIKN